MWTHDNTEETANNTLSTILPTRGTINQTVMALVVAPVSSLLDVNVGLMVRSWPRKQEKTYS
jgi:hypothetical protein